LSDILYLHCLTNLSCLWTSGLYLDHHTDVELSGSYDDVPKTNSLINKQKMIVSDDAEGGRVSLAE
jgi:hypothetical protein